MSLPQSYDEAKTWVEGLIERSADPKGFGKPLGSWPTAAHR